MRNINFETKFVILLLFLAFFDEVLTIQVGNVFVTPLKLFSVYSLFIYIFNRENKFYEHAYENSCRRYFVLLYSYVLIQILLEIVKVGGLNFSLYERFFHFLSSLIVLDLLVKYFSQGKINIKLITKTLIYIFFIELTVSLCEVILQRSIINFGLVQLSPLKIRGFHGDRIYLSEYLTLGCFLLYYGKKNKLVVLVSFLLSFLVIIVSGSNTGLLLMAIMGCYIAFTMKNKFLKVLLILLAILGSSTFAIIRSNFLSEADQIEVQKRNEMYYESEVSANSNWRLFAIEVIAENFISSPTLFGHGYESSSEFLEKESNYLYKMKAHNIISVIYEYGILGLIITLLLIFSLLRNALKMLLIRNRTVLTHLSFIFSILIISRFLFYFHTTIVWVYILGIAIIVYSERYIRFNKIK